MKRLPHRLIDPSTWRHLDRRLLVEPVLRRAVLASSLVLSVLCYVLAINAGR